MSSRTSGASPSPSTLAAAARASPPSKASVIEACSSRSDAIATLATDRLRETIGPAGFLDEHVERGHVGIPLHQARNRPESAPRMRVETPHGVSHGGAVVVDQDR